MSDEPNYIVMGDDGKEYGPVSAQQIRDWMAEGRLERKTPVKPDHAKDWVFLEMLPEFSGALNKIPPPKIKARCSRVLLVIILLFGLGAAAYFLLKK
jgi:hypothetical protein